MPEVNRFKHYGDNDKFNSGEQYFEVDIEETQVEEEVEE